MTDRCNLRCLYCMPEEGVDLIPKEEVLTFEEITRLTDLFVRMGVNKVRLTGGEPTIRRGFETLVKELVLLPGLDSLCLTTNGLRLEEYACQLAQSGLKGVNVSLDTLRTDRFEQITRRPGLDKVLAGIEAALKAGLQTKINVVVLPGHNDDEVLDFALLAESRELEVRFIEFMPFLQNKWSRGQVISSAQIRARLMERLPLEPAPSAADDVARRWTLPGWGGSVGFISSVTESFCDGCSRVRLTADGQFKTCLFLPSCLDLKKLLRSDADDDQISQAVRDALMTKWPGHPPMTNWRQLDTLSMVQIGG